VSVVSSFNLRTYRTRTWRWLHVFVYDFDMSTIFIFPGCPFIWYILHKMQRTWLLKTAAGLNSSLPLKCPSMGVLLSIPSFASNNSIIIILIDSASPYWCDLWSVLQHRCRMVEGHLHVLNCNSPGVSVRRNLIYVNPHWTWTTETYFENVLITSYFNGFIL